MKLCTRGSEGHDPMYQDILYEVDGPAAVVTMNRLMDESLERSDFNEGVKSFMERRPPNFARLQLD